MRQFKTGATRDNDATKPDYEGFLSPAVMARYAEYMNRNRVQADGKVRESDNWQKGIPKGAYIKSGLRHVFDWWLAHRGLVGREPIEDALCAVIFNASGYLFELLRERRAYQKDEGDDALTVFLRACRKEREGNDETRQREISRKAQALAGSGAGKLARTLHKVRPGRRATAKRNQRAKKARV